MSPADPLARELQQVADDGVAAVAVGTVLWAVAGIVCLLARARLADAGLGWLVWVCGCAVAYGIGLGLFVWRRHVVYEAHRARAAVSEVT